jgi:ribosomal protein L12E/L44/L45/RPP1/RPP2
MAKKSSGYNNYNGLGGMNPEMAKNFQDMIPRSIFAEADPDLLDRKGQTFTGGYGYGFNPSIFATLSGSGGAGNNIYRNPARRFYDPEITTTAIYLPRNIRQKNRWCRWFFDHDELVGAVLELHAELPYSRAEVMCDDVGIKKHVEDALDKTNFFSMMPMIDLEFMKIGEVFIHTPWDSKTGMWSSIIVHNPDFIDVRTSPFADMQSVIELKPDEELKSIIHSTKPEDQQLKKRLPKEVVRRVLTGKNLILDPNEVTHIARRSNPYDIRGTSMLNRLFRLLMYEDKLREAQITIADNFVYPLKLFKLGDPQKGWIPDETHQRALSQMLQQANFDPNFSLIYHYGLNVEYITVADKVMRLDKEWQEITDKKMIALGVSKDFMSGTSTYASANVGLQTQLARYKAKRDLFDVCWVRDKFMRVMAEKNGWYKRDAREIVGQFRVKRTAEELRQRLILPELMWHKKLMLRDDQQFLTFLQNVYAQGKGPVSGLTFLMAMGLDMEHELSNKKKQKKLEEMIGSYVQTPAAAAPGGGAPPLGALGALQEKMKFGKKKKEAEEVTATEETDIAPVEGWVFKENGEMAPSIRTKENVMEMERKSDLDLTLDLLPINNDDWHTNIKSPYVPSEVVFALTAYDTKLRALDRKYNGNFREGVLENSKDLLASLEDIYVQGKLTAYDWTDFLPIYRQHYARGDELRDYSDIVLSNEFGDWIQGLVGLDMEKDKLYRHLRDLSTTCYCFGQLKGFQEQGIYSVKVSNSQPMDGLRYKVEELNQKGKNLASVLSPWGEIVLFSPCIEGFDDVEIGNTIDPRITRYRNFAASGISIKDCPVEYVPFVERYINKLGKYLKNQYDNVIFVSDVVNVPEWENDQKRRMELDNKDIKSELRGYLVENGLVQEKIKKLGKVPVFKNGKTLYISSWIGAEDAPITANLIKYVTADMDSLEKIISRSFKNANYDLTGDEIETYRVFGYIKPVYDHKEEIAGWESVKNMKIASGIDEKIILGGAWDAGGKCIGGQDKDPVQLFTDNVRLWIDYPQKLSKSLKEAFDSL